jgi:CRISPR-associated protein Cas5t
MGCFYLQAKFGAFRPFTSGSFRITSGFITHSAAYGLLLNIAGIEMRHDDGKSQMTLIKQELPRVRIALGALSLPGRHSIFQQLHNYPIGTTGSEHAVNTKGTKYNIIPVKREFLSEIRVYICTEDNAVLDSEISEGLSGKTERKYGLPFLGDNNFLIDRLEPVFKREPAYWFEIVDEAQDSIRAHTTRLTTTIDRADLSRTRSFLFAPTETKKVDPPSKSWIVMP